MKEEKSKDELKNIEHDMEQMFCVDKYYVKENPTAANTT